MIYEAEIRQTGIGRIFIKASSEEEAERVVEQYIQDEQSLGSVDFDELLEYGIWGVSEADIVGDAGVIKAEDAL